MTCPARPATIPGTCCGTDCCWHELRRDTYRGGDSFMLKTEQCCWCQAIETVRLVLRKPDGHGPHATEVWHLDSTYTPVRA